MVYWLYIIMIKHMEKIMSINLKHSDNLDRDYKKLSSPRKSYVKDRAKNNGQTISQYLNEKYGVIKNEVE